MKVFGNLKELLGRLHTERKLLHALFQARMRFDFRYEDALELTANERNLQLLIDYGVVRQEGDLLELEEVYQRFFEEILRLNENITSATIDESLQQLRQNIDFYLKESKNPEAQKKYVNKIIRILRNTVSQATNKTVELKRVIDDTYRQEHNYEIKRQRLTDYMATLDSIMSLIRQTESVLDDRREVLDIMTPDQRITRLALNVKSELKEVFHTLIELEQTIRDYLHQIDAHNRMVKRIRRLKYLKDQLTWEKSTDVCHVLEDRSDLLLETASYYSPKVSLAFLRDSDEGLEIIKTARRFVDRRKKLTASPQALMSAEDLEAGYLVEDFVDTDVMADAFFASSQDLYWFVKNYPYDRPKELEQKVEYYTEILLNHHSRLLITDDWQSDGIVNYPLIYTRR